MGALGVLYVNTCHVTELLRLHWFNICPPCINKFDAVAPIRCIPIMATEALIAFKGQEKTLAPPVKK